MKHDDCFRLLDSPELLPLSRHIFKTKKIPFIWIAWTMWAHRTTIWVDSANDHKEQTPSNVGRNRACRVHLIFDKAFNFATSSREPLILLCQMEQLQKENLSATTILAVYWSCHIQREVYEMDKAVQGVMQLIEAMVHGKNCPLNFIIALGIKSLYSIRMRKQNLLS